MALAALDVLFYIHEKFSLCCCHILFDRYDEDTIAGDVLCVIIVTRLFSKNIPFASTKIYQNVRANELANFLQIKASSLTRVRKARFIIPRKVTV